MFSYPLDWSFVPMENVSRNPDGLFAHVLRPASRFIALLLAMGGAASTLPAQGPRGDSTDYDLMSSVGSKLDRVCAGDSVAFTVLALDHLTSGYRPTTGVLISGSVLNQSFGTLTPASTRTLSLSPQLQPSAGFTFDALLPGRTELRFTGMLAASGLNGKPQAYLPLRMLVNVVACEPQPRAGAGSGIARNRQTNARSTPRAGVVTISKVKVRTTSTWNAGMEIVATIDSGFMEADDRGHFTGSADVIWQTSMIGTAACGAAESATPPSRANLTGEVNESNQLVVTITFQPRDFSGFARCGPVAGSTSNLATPDPVTVSVATAGGTSTQTHAVTARNGSFAGSVTVVVTTESR